MKDAGAVRRPHSVRFAARYILRHIRRSALKSILTVLLAALMVGAISQFAQMRATYDELRVSTVITPRFIGSLTLSFVPEIIDKGYTADIYYEKSADADIHYKSGYEQIDIAVTNDISRYTGEETAIEFAPGYDESCLNEFGDVIFVGDRLMESCGYELGDTVRITPKERMELMMVKLRGEFAKEYPDKPLSDESIYETYGEGLYALIDNMADTFTIAGVFSTESGTYGNTAFTPGKNEIMANLGTGVLLDIAEFELSDNALADEMRDYGEELSEGGFGSFVMDTEKLNSVIRTSDILNSLYPAAIAAALVIGGFLCALIIIQSSKEAAIMRIQGTAKKKTRGILSAEPIALTVIGVLIGAALMAAIKGGEFSNVAGQTALFAALYAVIAIAASIVCSVFTTRKSILALLQAKE